MFYRLVMSVVTSHCGHGAVLNDCLVSRVQLLPLRYIAQYQLIEAERRKHASIAIIRSDKVDGPLRIYQDNKHFTDNICSYHEIPNAVLSSHTHISIWFPWIRYSDIMMSPMVSQITSVSIVCSTVCSRKHQNSTSVMTGYRWIPLTMGQ